MILDRSGHPMASNDAARRAWQRLRSLLLALSLLSAAGTANAADFVAPLQQTYAASAERLRNTPFRRPLYIDSAERDGSFEGHVHAAVERPFAEVQRALGEPAQWCELLILLPNIVECRPAAGGQRLAIRLVKKFDAPRDAGLPIEFSFAREQQADGLQVSLQAPRGPIGTRNYRIALQVVPVAAQRSFLHLRYAYDYGLSARIAAQAYLAGAGSGKRGFTVIGREANGAPLHIGGLRGAVERNAMRCYLAIDAAIDAFEAPAAQRFETALQRWVHSVRDYRQLQEEDFSAYVAAKRRNYRQEAQR
jgi:hypothetical protein